MFGNATIALLLSLGFAAWVYAKIMRSSGNNTKSALTVAGCAALVCFILALMLLNLIPSN
jgi:hypothetical protein